MRLRLTLIGVLLIMGCGRNSEDAANSANIKEPIVDAAAAKARFLNCMDSLFPEFEQSPWTSLLRDKTSQPENFTAEIIEPTEAFGRIDNTLTVRERRQLILHGTLDSLKNHQGTCWAVRSFGGFGNELVGYIDRESGEPVLIWIVPEG